MPQADVPIQDLYSDANAHCFGCGRLNEHGLHVKTTWDPDDASSTTAFTPDPKYTGGVPDNLYGGLLASLIDCHSAATASAARHVADGRVLGDGELPRFVTASINVEYLAPTPAGEPLTLRGTVEEISERRVTVATVLSAAGKERVHGRAVLALRPPA